MVVRLVELRVSMLRDENYVIAVSGGVDSVALLGMLVNGNLPPTTYHPPSTNLIVAHFDHGIRNESADDALFVRDLAAKYNLPFETRRENLGKNASEEKARERRYAFLREVAKKHKATIVTAHHANDVVETIAINLTRGTGWRGLAVLDSVDIWRPLLATSKNELLTYAKQHNLTWHEDATNEDTKYLRNDLRQKLTHLDVQTRELLLLYRNRQVALKKQIDDESALLIGNSPYRRHMFISANHHAALEMLRAVFVREVGQSLTRPQLARALHAVKVYHAGKIFPVSSKIHLTFTKTHFVVDTKDKMV